MATKGVHVLMSAAHAQVVQAWLQANKGPQEMLRLLQQIGATSQSAGRKGGRSFNSMTREAGRFAGSLIGIGSAFQAAHTAISVIRGEFEKLKQVQRDAADQTISTGEELSKIRKVTLAPGADVTADEILSRARGFRSPLQVPERLRVIQEAIQAGSRAETTGERVDIAVEAMKLLGDQLRGDTAALVEFAKGAVVLQKAFPDRTKQEIILAITQALSASPAGFENLQQFSQNMVPLLAYMRTEGFTLKDAIANAIGLQIRAIDVEGASTRTTWINTLQDLREQLPIEIAGTGQRMLDFLRSDEGSKVSNNLLRSASESLRKLAQERGLTMAQLQRQLDIPGVFTPTTRARAKTEFALIELLQPEGFAEAADQTKAMVDATRRNILEGQAAQDDWNRRMRESAQSLNELAFAVDNAIRAQKAEADFNVTRSIRAQLATAIEELFPRAGGGAMGAQLASTIATIETMRADPIEAVEILIRALEERAAEMRAVEARAGVMAGGFGYIPSSRRELAVSEETAENIAMLREAAMSLREIVNALRTDRVNPPVNTPSASPAADAFQP